MKTRNTLLLKVISIAALSTLLLTTGACQQKKADSPQAENSKTEVKPPQIDIHTAVATGNMDALRQHIAAGSDINAKDPFGGSSPLISAAVFGKTDAAKALIDAGADVNIQNNDGSTALHCAAFFCRPEIVKMLLDKHADKTIKNNYNLTAYENVSGPFRDMKPAYDMILNALAPMGLKLDYVYVEKTRPEIAAVLK